MDMAITAPMYLTFCSTLGWEPPEDSVPHPVTSAWTES